MKEYILDTNCILRYLLDDIKSQADFIEHHLLLAKKGEITLSFTLMVMSECVFALTKVYRMKKEDVVNRFGDLISLPYIGLDNIQLMKESLLNYNKYSLSFTDAYLLALAKINQKVILTFDQKLKKLQKSSER